MDYGALQATIEQAFEDRASIGPGTTGAVRDAVDDALGLLDSGTLRVAAKSPPRDGARELDRSPMAQESRPAVVPPQRHGHGSGWPGRIVLVRQGAVEIRGLGREPVGRRRVPCRAELRRAAVGLYRAPGAILMPSFVNLGAYVDRGTMVDTWVTVGSCAQIGKNVHLSGGVGIGGVLEPLQANPTIIEDDCFIGARSEVVEGVIVGQGSVLSMGVFISASTKIVDRATGETHVGYVPPYSVVVSGNLPGRPLPDGSPGPSLYCAVIVKTVDAQTRAKTAINDLLRD